MVFWASSNQGTTIKNTPVQKKIKKKKTSAKKTFLHQFIYYFLIWPEFGFQIKFLQFVFS